METHPSLSHSALGAWHFDGFEALDICHRETLRTLGQLAELVGQLERSGPDRRTRAMAKAIDHHFSTTMREHHEDEERHVFPGMAAMADEPTAQALACLAQDHFWLEADWRELAPLLDAAASGLTGGDIDALRRGVDIFAALCRDHVALEESLIYPQAISRMADNERESMNREMALRRHGKRAAPARV